MKLELTKEEMDLISEIIFGEFLEMNKIKNNKFIDKTQVETYIEKLRCVLDKMCCD